MPTAGEHIASRATAADPNRVAVRVQDRALTYGALQDAVGRMAGALTGLGLVAGDRVAIHMRDGIDAVIAILGSMAAGAIAVPLPELATSDDLRTFLRDAAASIAIVEQGLETMLDEVRGELPELREVVCAGVGSAGMRDLAALLAAAPAPTDLRPLATSDAACVLLYSSAAAPDGARGVPHSSASILAAAVAAESVAPLSAEDRVLSIARLSTAYGLGSGLLFPLLAGAEIVLLPEQPTSERVFGLLQRTQPSVVVATPSLYGQLANDADAHGQRGALARVRLALGGAEGMPDAMLQRIHHALGCEVVVGYGLTEIFGFAIVAGAVDGAGAAQRSQVRPAGSGTPLPGVELRVVGEDGGDAEVDEIGTLWVRCPSLFTGYWAAAGGELDPVLAAQPALSPDGWFATKDRFLRDALGRLHHCGRVDDQFKVGGKWVSPLEIERALTAHEAVWECAVIGEPDEDGFVKPLAFVVVNVGHQAGPALDDELRQYVKQVLAPYKYPRWIEFIETLPRGPGGKVLRYKLKAPRRRRRPETGHRT